MSKLILPIQEAGYSTIRSQKGTNRVFRRGINYCPFSMKSFGHSDEENELVIVRGGCWNT